MSIGRTSLPSRAEQIRSFLEQFDLEAWIAWRPDELVMLSGYFPFWGASLLIYFRQAQPVLFVPQIEPKDHIPSGLPVREYPWGDLKCADPYSALVSSVGDELVKARVKSAEVGINSSGSRSSLPMQAAEQIPMPEDFQGKLSGLTRKPDARCAKAFTDLYLRKSPEEIQAIRLANRVACVGLEVFFESAQAGTSEAEIASAVESSIYRQVGRDGIFHSRAWAMVQSGPNSADAGRFNRSSARRLENGDLVLIELATCVNGFWSDLTRTTAVGSPRAEVEQILALVKGAQQAALDELRPGVTAGHIDAAAREWIAAQGLAAFFTHGTGHHVGFRYHDPGFGIVPGEPSTLERGMVVTIEPGVYVHQRGAGARVEDNVLITESGHETLSRAEGSKQG